MKVDKDGSGYHAKCLNSHLALDLKDEHKLWFDKVGSHRQIHKNSIFNTVVLIIIAINAQQKS